MRITELFGILDKPKQWEYTHFGDEDIVVDFKIGEVPYMFVAHQDMDEAPGDWDVEFVAKDAPPGVSRFGITGTGRSSEVFSIVVDILRDFLKKKKKTVRRLTFSAKEGSRQDLYARMAKRLLPTWNLEQQGADFILTRTDLKWWVYSVEPPYNKIPPISVSSSSANKAIEKVLSDPNSEFKGADPMGMAAGAKKPKR